MSNAAESAAPEITPDQPYQSLYRRYRPKRFGEVRGQTHVTQALRNAVANERVTHAYLFSGPRGTGKTSTARILAKALNCTDLDNGEPCGRCDSCRSIDAGSSFDVHELDAASNNGVDAMRDLVARAALASPGRWKVYIVDEVHMLSSAASNSLLKTLEEPPGHVVFVLATTDPQKVLPTIRSRTQHFEFHLLGEDILTALLQDVATNAALTLPDGAIDVARRRGRGSARDALSVLDQVATAGMVGDDSDALGAMITAIADRDAGRAVVALDEALHSGRDPHQVAIELVERLRAGFLAVVAPGLSRNGDDVTIKDGAEARTLGAPRCVRAMELIGTSIVAMRDAPDPRITLEVALIRLTHAEAEDSNDALLERIERLERRLESSANAPSSAPPPSAPPPPNAPRSPSTAAQRPAPPRKAARQDTSHAPEPGNAAASPSTPAPGPSAAMPTRDAIVAAWGDRILVGLRPKLRMIYQAGRFVEVRDETAVFALPSAAQLAYAEPLCSEVAAVLSNHFARNVALTLIQEKDAPAPVGLDDEEESIAQPGASAEELDEIQQHEIGDEVATGDPKLGAAWAEDRILQAFPGAEEV